ncbi:MAG: response regulator transcription factor [Acidobacteriota bacterium]|nr:response regulator transcription factor [Acidobacteriota bacterium]
MQMADNAILLAEDDTELCALMRDFFRIHAFRLDAVHNGRDAIKRAVEEPFDIVILDVMMPVLDGFEALRQIRKRSAVPVIMLTARSAAADRIQGLNNGADDYLAKPFAPDELLARVRAVLRRFGKALSAGTLVCGGLMMNPSTREVWKRSEPISLTSTEFDILECLMHSAGQVVTRDGLAGALYQREANPFERSLDVHISNLRRKLDDQLEAFIHTIRGSGYLLAAKPRAGKPE